MLRLIMAICLLAFHPAVQAQYGISIGNFYPRTIKVPAKIFEQFDKQVYSGCETGNCREGEGVWLEIIAEGYGRTIPDPANQRKTYLIYRITKGSFLDEGRICRGQQTLTYVPLERNGPQVDYLPVYYGHRLDTSSADLVKGDFIRSSDGYYPEEETELRGMAIRYGYKKVKVLSRNATVHYASVEYADSDSIRSFSGMVDENLRPVYGVGTLRNGTVFNGFFIRNRTGPGFLFKNISAVTGTAREGADQLDFLPDLRLLQKVFSQTKPIRNFELKLGWGSAEQEREAGMPSIALSRDLGLWTQGWLIGEDGLPKPSDYTGKGIYFYDSRQFYFGSFTKGVPDGMGSFYKRHIGGLWVDISKAPVFLKTGLFSQGTFTAGHFVFEEAGVLYSRALPLSKIDEPLFPDLAKAANGNNPEALLLLGEKYLAGQSVTASSDKAIRYFERALIFGSVKAAIRLGELYIYGYPSLLVKPDREKATACYLRGAQLQQTAHAGSLDIEKCKRKYLLLKYPFLNEEQAARFTLDDEYNLLSDLNKLRSEDSEKRAQGQGSQPRNYSQDEINRLVGKMFFQHTSFKSAKNSWTNYVMFYKIMAIEGEKVKIIRSSTLSAYIEQDTRPLSWFMNASQNGLTEATKKYDKCRECGGSGIVESKVTYKHTQDYEYTLGVRVTTTSTRSTNVACKNCGGAGFCPVDGSTSEWVWK